MNDNQGKAYYRIIKDFDSTKKSVVITQFNSNKLGIIITGICFIMFVISMLVFFFTPIKQWAPGFPDRNMKIEILKLESEIEKINRDAILQDNYISNIKNILNGENTALVDKEAVLVDSINAEGLKHSVQESKFREKVELKDKFNTFDKDRAHNKYSFYRPLEGIITDHFNPKIKHYGVDVVATQNEPIKSVQTGTVVFAGWTSSDGYVITIQHADNYLSIYKHNSSLLKGLGDNVLFGEVIALIGNTGKLSQGEHLHLEIWQNGYPVDPEKLINF